MSQHSFDDLREALGDAFNADRPALTIMLARRILDMNPTHASTLTRLGHALMELANYEDAESAIALALQHCPEDRRHIVLAKMGHLYKLRGDYDTAAAWFQKVIDTDPDDATGYIFLGTVLARQGKLDDAETAHRTATKCLTGCIDEAHHNLGLILRGKGRLEESLQCFTTALEIDPDFAAAKHAYDDVRAAIQWNAK